MYLIGVHLTGVHLLQVYISYRHVQLVGVRICPGRHTTVLGGMRPTAQSQNALAEMRTPQPHTICMAHMKIPSFHRGVVAPI